MSAPKPPGSSGRPPRRRGGNPPVEHQWKPGQSGNPGGRPKKKTTVQTRSSFSSMRRSAPLLAGRPGLCDLDTRLQGRGLWCAVGRGIRQPTARGPRDGRSVGSWPQAANLFNEHYLGFVGNASALTTATLTPGNLYGIVPKEANRYGGITVSASF